MLENKQEPIYPAWLELKSEKDRKIFVPIDFDGEVLFHVRVRDEPLDGGLHVGDVILDKHNLRQIQLFADNS